jgi:hypothetical protein
LHELQRLFLIEAARYNVLPLDDRFAETHDPEIAGRPVIVSGTSQLLFPGMRSLNEDCVLNFKNRSHSITAQLVIPDGGANGVLFAQGGVTGGWSLYLKDGRPKYHYNFANLEHYERWCRSQRCEPLPGRRGVVTCPGWRQRTGGPEPAARYRVRIPSNWVFRSRIASSSAALLLLERCEEQVAEERDGRQGGEQHAQGDRRAAVDPFTSDR